VGVDAQLALVATTSGCVMGGFLFVGLL